MPSTYTVNLGIEKPATGEQSGTWGDTTNVNFDILDQAVNGAARVTLTSAGSSGSPNTLAITNGATSDGRNKWVEFYSSSDLGGNVFVQLDPNDAEKIVFVRNSLAGSRSILLFQGTYNSGRDLEIPAGVDMVVKFDGGGASAATVTDVYTKLRATEITTPTLTAGTADINGGTLDGSVIGGASAAAITGTTVVANTSLNIAGDGATVTGIKDEDDMASNSATKLATQQSIKAYVDSQVGTVDTLAEILANGNTTGGTDIVVSVDDVISLDNGTNALPSLTTTGDLNTGLYFPAADEVGITTGGTQRLKVSSTGIDITGGFTATVGSTITTADNTSQLTLISTDADANKGPALDLYRNSGSPASGDDTGRINFQGKNDAGQAVTYTQIFTEIVAAGDGVESGRYKVGAMLAGDFSSRMDVTGSETVFNDDSKDLDFRVEGNNHTHAIFLQASSDRVGINESSPDTILHISDSSAPTIRITNTDTTVSSGQTLSEIQFEGSDASTNADGIRAKVTALSGGIGGFTSLQFFTAGENTETLTRGLDIHPTRATFNEDGGDVDFRVESNNSEYMLYVDGGQDTVGIKTNATDAALNVNSQSNSIDGIRVVGSGGNNFITGYGNQGNIAFSIFENGSDDPGTVKLYRNGTESVIITADENTTTVFNEQGEDNDFRVESDSQTHMLFVDAGNNQVKINTTSTSAPSAVDLVVGGGIHASYADDIALSYQAGTYSNYYKGMSGKNPYNDVGRGLHIFNYDNDSDTGINFWSGSSESSSLYSIANFNAGATGEVVFNDSGLDRDFRVESDSNANMLFIDAGANSGAGRLSIGGATQSGVFTVQGGTTTEQSMWVYGEATGKGGRLLSLRDTRATSGTDGSAGIHLTSSPGTDYVLAKYYDGSTSNFMLTDQTGNQYISIESAANIVINQDGSSAKDFRVESGSNTHALFVDASTSRTHINGSTDYASVSGVLNVHGTDNNITLNVVSTDSDAATGPSIQLLRATSSPADGDITGEIRWRSSDSVGNSNTMSIIRVITDDVTDGSEDGRLQLMPVINDLATSAIEMSASGVVVNESSADLDFRVESDNQPNALFVDAANDTVEIRNQVFGTAPTVGGGHMVQFNTNQTTVSSNSSVTVNLFTRSPNAEVSATGTVYISAENSGGSVQVGCIIDFFFSNGTLNTTARETGSSQGTITFSVQENGAAISVTVAYTSGIGGAIRFNAGGIASLCSY